LPWESFSSAGPAPVSSAVFWIRERYRNQGYLQAEVTDVQTPFSEDHRWVTVTITISEGKQTRVGSVEVTGSDAALGERRVELALEVGKPFRSDALETGRRARRRRCRRRAVPDRARGAGSDRPHRRSGQHYMHDTVIRRALPFAPGEPLDPAKLA
jgi:hypothetical protein